MATFKVPFFKGNLLHDVDGWHDWQGDKVEWRNPEPFHAWLTIHDMYRNGHSVYYEWRDMASMVTYPMMVSDMLTLLKTTNVIAGCVNADWVIVKRGRAYGIRKA